VTGMHKNDGNDAHRRAEAASQRQCVACGGSLEGRRADAQSCGGACRAEKSRLAQASQGPDNGVGNESFARAGKSAHRRTERVSGERRIASPATTRSATQDLSSAPSASDFPRLCLTKREAAQSLAASVDFFEAHVLPEIRVIRIGRKVIVPVVELEAWVQKRAAPTLSAELEGF
jgi:hypothetical protein